MEEQLQRRGAAEGFMEGLGAGGCGCNLGYTDGVNADLDMNAIGRAAKQQEVVQAKINLQKKLAVGKILGIKQTSYRAGRFKQQWLNAARSGPCFAPPPLVSAQVLWGPKISLWGPKTGAKCGARGMFWSNESTATTRGARLCCLLIRARRAATLGGCAVVARLQQL
jgi:hypothetical protein